MRPTRPYISSIRPYTWRDTKTQETVHGIGLFKGTSLCTHLTEKEAVKFATELLDVIEKARSK